MNTKFTGGVRTVQVTTPERKSLTRPMPLLGELARALDGKAAESAKVAMTALQEVLDALDPEGQDDVDLTAPVSAKK